MMENINALKEKLQGIKNDALKYPGLRTEEFKGLLDRVLKISEMYFKNQNDEQIKALQKATFLVNQPKVDSFTNIIDLMMDEIDLNGINFIKKRELILSFSEKFYSIYEDGLLLENRKSLNAGALYRKAIEYVVVDYIILCNPAINISKNTISFLRDALTTLEINFGDDLINFICNSITIGHDFVHHRKKDLNFEDIIKLRENIETILRCLEDDFKERNKKTEFSNFLKNRNNEMQNKIKS